MQLELISSSTCNSADPPQLPGDSPSLQPPEDNLPTEPRPTQGFTTAKEPSRQRTQIHPRIHNRQRTQTHPQGNVPGMNSKAKQMMFKRRQNRVKPHSNHVKKPIDVESYKPKRSKIEKRWWIPELGLVQSDRDILLSPTEWLSDNIVNASQKLLKKANPRVSDLQDVACGLTMNFVVEPDEFVQIIHTCHGHWNTISTIVVMHQGMFICSLEVMIVVSSRLPLLLH